MKRSLIMFYILTFPLPALAAGNTPLATGLGMTSCDQFTKTFSPHQEWKITILNGHRVIWLA